MSKSTFSPSEVKVLRESIAELMKARDSEYINKDGTFKGGFDGCVRYQREKKGLSDKSAHKLCAYIGRRAGKIP